MVFVVFEVTKEVKWLKMFLIRTKGSSLCYIIQDPIFYNSRMVAQSKEPSYHKKRKRMEKKYYLIYEIVKKGDIIVEQILSAVPSLLLGLVEVC